LPQLWHQIVVKIDFFSDFQKKSVKKTLTTIKKRFTLFKVAKNIMYHAYFLIVIQNSKKHVSQHNFEEMTSY